MVPPKSKLWFLDLPSMEKISPCCGKTFSWWYNKKLSLITLIIIVIYYLKEIFFFFLKTTPFLYHRGSWKLEILKMLRDREICGTHLRYNWKHTRWNQNRPIIKLTPNSERNVPYLSSVSFLGFELVVPSFLKRFSFPPPPPQRETEKERERERERGGSLDRRPNSEKRRR